MVTLCSQRTSRATARVGIGALLVLMIGICAPAAAQSGSGVAAIDGTVAGPDNQLVPGALITILSTDTGYERSVYTDARGRYFAPAMPVGSYFVQVSSPNFARVVRDGVRLNVGATQTIDFTLKVAKITETVTVTGEIPHLDKDETATSAIIGSRAVSDLPIRGRDFTEFVQLTPGITQDADRNGLVISGQRSINSNIAIDGTDFNDALQGNQRGGNEAAFFFPQAAILEFQVVRSGATAEVGRTNSGFVNVVTKSGSNVVHGEGFYYGRERSLTSPDAFDRRLNNQQSQFGGSVGGPLKHDSVFFFGAAEQSLLKVPYVVQFDAQAPGVTVPAALLAQQGEQMATNNPTAVFGRVDVVLGSAGLLNIQGTYTHLHGQNFNFDSLQLNQAVTTNFTRITESRSVKAGLTSMFGPGLLNEIRAQVATDPRDEIPNVKSALISITGFGNLGGDAGRPRAFDTIRYELSDSLTMTTGAHRIRAGFDVNLNDVQQNREDNIQGRYDYKSLSDFIAGKISRYRQTVLTFNPDDAFFKGRQREIAAFVQDKISLGADVTATLGLRWEGQWNPQPTKPNPAIPSTAFIPNDLKQWQPRGGIVWDASGSGTTVVRLSGGLYDARTPSSLFQRVFTDNGITTIAVDSKFDPAVLNALTFPNPLSSVPAGLKVAAPRVFGFDPAFRNPRSWQGSATVERLLGQSFTVSLGYVFSATSDLQRRLDRNLFAPTSSRSDVRSTVVRFFVGVGSISLFSTIDFFLSFQCLDHRVQRLEACAPEMVVPLDPRCRFLQSTHAERAGPHAPDLLRGDEPRLFQDAHVLLHSRERHVKRLGKIRDRRVCTSELLKNAASRGVGECGERGIEGGAWMLNHMVQYTRGPAAAPVSFSSVVRSDSRSARAAGVRTPARSLTLLEVSPRNCLHPK